MMCVAFVAALFTSCQNNDELTVPTKGLVLTASTQSSTRINFVDGDGVKLTWAEGDRFTVYNADGNRVGNFKLRAGAGGSTAAEFLQDETDATSFTLSETGNTAVYPVSSAATLSEVDKSLNSVFEYIPNDLSYLDEVCHMEAQFNYNSATGIATKIEFKHQFALLKITIGKPNMEVEPQELIENNKIDKFVIKCISSAETNHTITFSNTNLDNIFDGPNGLVLHMFVAPTEANMGISFHLILNSEDGNGFIENITTKQALEAGKRYTGTLNNWSKNTPC